MTALHWILAIAALIAGVALCVAFLGRFYRKAAQGFALIRTGLGGRKVVMDGGCLSLPFLHRVEEIKARNLERVLRAAYDDALDKVDLLLMPTLPMKATPLPPPDAPLSLIVRRAFEMIPNTAPFSCTGHPAMNVPCGLSEGLPVGMMLVGRHWGESVIYRAAAAFEKSGDWRKF